MKTYVEIIKSFRQDQDAKDLVMQIAKFLGYVF